MRTYTIIAKCPGDDTWEEWNTEMGYWTIEEARIDMEKLEKAHPKNKFDLMVE